MVTLIERMWLYHEQCEEERKKMYNKESPLGGKAALLLDRAREFRAKEKGLDTRKEPLTEEQLKSGIYSAWFWIYEEKRYARWPEYIEFYRKQDEEEEIF
tara:strand:+ start:353 stop:652 length:300 start_codon:yes stop_codon:yes gene_type:complete